MLEEDEKMEKIIDNISLEKIIESFEVRSVLEGNATFRAALNTPDTRKLEEYVEQMDHCASGEEFLRINTLFHNEIFRISNAATHAEFVKILVDREPLTMVVLTQKDRLRINEEHRDIVRALRAADGNRAELAAKQHVLHVMADCVDRINAGE